MTFPLAVGVSIGSAEVLTLIAIANARLSQLIQSHGAELSEVERLGLRRAVSSFEYLKAELQALEMTEQDG